MVQVFGPGANSLARFSLVGGVFGLGVLFVVLEFYVRSPYITAVGQPIDQPVAFSHKHHVTDDGIDCRYCHTTVENSAFAGMPSTQTCMNCHSEVWANSPALQPVRQSFVEGQPLAWARVNNLPGYVYFDHSIHVQKGVGCSAESMQMGFCLDCHQDPAKFLRPREQVFNMTWQPPADQERLGRDLMAAYHVQSKISCSTCHR